ncbi:MAG: hypothetical protein ACKVH8_00555 [Pirellulales bacterium]
MKLGLGSGVENTEAPEVIEPPMLLSINDPNESSPGVIVWAFKPLHTHKISAVLMGIN